MIFRLLVPDPQCMPSLGMVEWVRLTEKKKELDPLVNAAFVDELPPLERRFATVHSHSLNGSTKEGR